MKTEQEIKQDVFDYLRAIRLDEAVSGRLIKESHRPMMSDEEDVVLSILSSDHSTEYQRAIVQVNVYVRDLRLDSGEPIEHSKRLTELSRLFAKALDVVSGSDYRFTLERQHVLAVEGKDEHCINNRLLYQHLHERE